LEPFLVFGEKGPKFLLAVVSGIVDDHSQLLSMPIFTAQEGIQELMEGNPVEHSFLRLDAETPFEYIDCSPVSEFLPVGSRGDFGLRSSGPPHPDDTCTLLEMHLILRPYVNIRLTDQLNQFFLKAACFSGSAPLGYVRGRSKRIPNLWNIL